MNREDVIKELLNFGYKENEIIIILQDLNVKRLKYKILLEHIKGINQFLLKEGYKKEEIIKKICDFPRIYSYSPLNVESKTITLQLLGYNKVQIHKMLKKFPKIYSYGNKNITKKLEELEEIGYSRQDIIKMTVVYPSLFGFNIKTIKQRKQNLEI